MTKTKVIHVDEPKKQNVIRINTPDDIPNFLKHSIIWDNSKKQLLLQNIDCYKKVPFGSIIGYEESKFTHSGWICWPIESEDD